MLYKDYVTVNLSPKILDALLTLGIDELETPLQQYNTAFHSHICTLDKLGSVQRYMFKHFGNGVNEDNKDDFLRKSKYARGIIQEFLNDDTTRLIIRNKAHEPFNKLLSVGRYFEAVHNDYDLHIVNHKKQMIRFSEAFSVIQPEACKVWYGEKKDECSK